MQRTENLGLYTVGDSEEFQYQQLINENMETIDRLGRAYLIDAGTSGNWTWVKYSDGTAECDMRITVAVSTTRASGAGWRSEDLSYNFPLVFAEPPSVTCSPESASNTLWASLRATTTARMTMFYMSFDKVAHAGSCNVHVKGKVA